MDALVSRDEASSASGHRDIPGVAAGRVVFLPALSSLAGFYEPPQVLVTVL
jgi:hypothetical protein